MQAPTLPGAAVAFAAPWRRALPFVLLLWLVALGLPLWLAAAAVFGGERSAVVESVRVWVSVRKKRERERSSG